MARRRGNPNWGKPILDDMPVVPSRFEKLVAQLGLEDKPEEWTASAKLRAWARANRKDYFVPEKLLLAWKLVISDD